MLLLEEVGTTELSNAHRSGAGGLIAHASSEAHSQHQTDFRFVCPTSEIEDSQSQAATSSSSEQLEGEGRVSWSSLE